MLKLMMSRRAATGLALAAAVTFSSAALAPASAETATSAVWQGLHKDLFGGREVLDAKDMISMDAPIRAEDAAVVPITIKMPASFAANVKSLTLVVDQNPSPVVAAIKYGAAAGTGDRMLSTRIRMDQYSDVRAIAETTDGKLYMISKFVKASGGCSAPAAKDAEEAAKSLGKMQIKKFVSKEGDALTPEMQFMIKHPNTTGMQMDQLTGLYTPARYVNKIEVKSGADVIFSMEGGISISEDPNFRFTHGGKAGDPVEVKAEDSDGASFAGQLAPSQS